MRSVMGLFSRRAPAERVVRNALTAAATRIDGGDDGQERTLNYLKRLAQWQRRAWEFFDIIPEVPYAARYYGNAISRLVLIGAIHTPQSTEPAPLNPEGDEALGYDADEAALVTETLDALKGPLGGQSEILRRLALQLFVAGEGLLLGREDSKYGGERWDVYSTEEATRNRDEKVWEFRNPPTHEKSNAGSVRERIPENQVVAIRVWRSHPRYVEWADAPMRAAEMILDELLVLTKAINAVALSRSAGPGIFFLPMSMRNSSGDPSSQGSSEQAVAEDQFVRDLVNIMGAAVSDPMSAAAQVPNFVFVPDRLYADIGSDKLVQWSRELDEIMQTQRESLIRRFATAVDFPAEVMTGIEDINHWGAATLPAEGFRAHFAPGANLIVDALSTRYLWPALTEAGVQDPERFLVWYDPSALISPVDQAKDYQWAHENYLVSDEAAREALGIGEDEAPEQAEIVARVTRAVALKGSAPGANGNGDETARPEPEPPRPMPGGRPAAIVAAGNGRAESDPALERLPSTLGRMDATLLDTILTSADAAMRRALEKANVKVRSLANRDSALRTRLHGVRADTLELIPALGPKMVETLAVGDDLLTGAFDRLGVETMRRIARGGEEAIRLAVAAGDLSDAEARILLDRLDDDREAAWALMLAGLTALAAERMFAPFPDQGPGEVSDTLVPAGLVRDGLIRAGGGGGVSMMTGLSIIEVFRRAGISLSGRRWVYGDPASRTHPFEPHRILDGETFADWNDPKLTYPDWPYQRQPGDHRGCQCGAEFVYATRVETVAPTIPSTQEVA